MTEREILDEVLRLFVGPTKTKRPRAKPHRCFDCGRVTRHVRCPECARARARRQP